MHVPVVPVGLFMYVDVLTRPLRPLYKRQAFKYEGYGSYLWVHLTPDL